MYDADNIAMCLLSEPVGNAGGYSYLYKIQERGQSNGIYADNSTTQTTISGQRIQCIGDYSISKVYIEEKGEFNMINFTNEILKKYNWNIDKIRVFDSFAGIGALHNSLKFLGIPTEIIGLSETDINATISYAAVHIDGFKDMEFEYPSESEMKDWLMNRNIGWDFVKQKSCVPRMKKDTLYKAYKANYLLNNLGDISKIDYSNMPDFDLFNFSFPCTDLSVAGKRQGMTNEDGTTTRSGLAKYGIELIKAKKPKYIMIENVKGLITKKFINDFFSIVAEIKSYGYTCYCHTKEDNKGNVKPMCLNAKNYGIPQNRERIFVICVRNDCEDSIDQFWEGKDFGYRLKDFLENTVDEKYYLSQQIQDRFKRNEVEDTEHNDLNVVGTSDPNKKIGQRDVTYGINGIMSTLMATDYKQPKQILDNVIDEKYYINKSWYFSTENDMKHDTNEIAQVDNIQYKATRSVSDPELYCRTLDTMGGGQREPKVLEEVIVGACRGRYTETGDIEQRLELNTEGTTNTLTSVQKDNYIIENKINRIGQVSTGNSQCGTVYDDRGVFTTACAGTHGYAMGNIHSNYRIRKLTPKECWRLMGFTDEQFERAKAMGISDSALYKQAGNNIVVNCLYYIFKELFKNHIIEE